MSLGSLRKSFCGTWKFLSPRTKLMTTVLDSMRGVDVGLRRCGDVLLERGEVLGAGCRWGVGLGNLGEELVEEEGADEVEVVI